MPKRNTLEDSTTYAERYADENLSDRKQSGFALDHPPDDRCQSDFAHRFTDELKAITTPQPPTATVQKSSRNTPATGASSWPTPPPKPSDQWTSQATN